MGVVVVRLRWETMYEKEGGGEILVCIGSGCVWCMENVDVWFYEGVGARCMGTRVYWCIGMWV